MAIEFEKVFHANGNHWYNNAVRKMIITENQCIVYLHNRKTPIKFTDVFSAGVEIKPKKNKE